MSLSKSVPLEATTRSPMNQHVYASKLFYLRLISVISSLLLKPEPHFVYFGWRIADISDFIYVVPK